MIAYKKNSVLWPCHFSPWTEKIGNLLTSCFMLTIMIQMDLVVCELLGKAKALSVNSQSVGPKNQCLNQDHDFFS
jgi:hypothetical protein